MLQVDIYLREGQICLGKAGGSVCSQMICLGKAKVNWCRVASLNYEEIKGNCRLKQVVLRKTMCGGKDTRHLL